MGEVEENAMIHIEEDTYTKDQQQNSDVRNNYRREN